MSDALVAQRFVEAAAWLCEQSKCLGVHSTAVLLHSVSGPALLVVDNFPDVTDETRWFATSLHNWQNNPVFIALRSQLGVLDDTALDQERYIEKTQAQGIHHGFRNHFVAPLLSPGGWFGTCLFGHIDAFTAQLERSLAMFALQLSVWCTEHGVGLLPDVAEGRQLGPQQFRVAKLAAAGRTNAEIADEIGISINTVKARLKEVFERLSVDNRTELARVVLRLAPLDEVSLGITRLGAVTVTRAS